VTEPQAPLDEAALARYLEAHWPGFKGALTAAKFDGGQSNPTYRLHHAGGSAVLRKKPPGALLKSAHAIEREYRVMQALAGSDVPVPRMYVLCEDPSVIGTPFFVMDHVDGRIFWDPALPDMSKPDRATIYDEMNRVLAALHSLDPVAVGLGDFGRPGNYFARQLARWTEQYCASETQTLPDMNALITWLKKALPADDGRASLVHGDYRIDNMIFDAASPRMLAVLDWELSTIGHPFADLAYQCMQWRLPNGGTMRGLAGIDRQALGIPTEAAYVASYEKRTGADLRQHWTFYLAFSFFRLAAILQGVLKRALSGNASNPEKGLRMGERVPLLASMALAAINSPDRTA
jgi:aminoglycoside phosphotransferase (APT) family kinase protein